MSNSIDDQGDFAHFVKPTSNYSGRQQRPITLKQNVDPLVIPSEQTPPDPIEPAAKTEANSVSYQPPAAPQTQRKRAPVAAARAKRASAAAATSKAAQQPATPSVATPDTKPAQQAATPPTPSAPAPWDIPGMSQDVVIMAEQAAKLEGVELHVWLENVIRKSITQPQEESAAEAQLSNPQLEGWLQDIVARLERIEEQRGLVARFWEWLNDLPR